MLPLLLLIAAVAAASPGRAPADLDDLLARFERARGGHAALAKVKRARLLGRLAIGPGNDGQATVDLARGPFRIHTQIDFGPRRFEQGWDGTTAWAINPFRGDSVAQVISGDDARNVAAGADYDGPLLDWRAKGHHASFAGPDTADGRPAYKIAVVTAAGLHDTYWLDAQSYMQTKWEGVRAQGADTVTFVSYFRNYRVFGGVPWAMRIDSETKGQPGGQLFLFDSVAVNVAQDTSMFRKPEGVRRAGR